MKDKTSKQMLYKSKRKNGLYIIPYPVPPIWAKAALPAPRNTAKDWLYKLDHPGNERPMLWVDKCE